MLVRGAIAGFFNRSELPHDTKRWVEWQWYIGVGATLLGSATLLASIVQP